MNLGATVPWERCPTRISNEDHSIAKDTQNKTSFPMSYWARKAGVPVGTFKYRAKVLAGVASTYQLDEADMESAIKSFRNGKPGPKPKPKADQ